MHFKANNREVEVDGVVDRVESYTQKPNHIKLINSMRFLNFLPTLRVHAVYRNNRGYLRGKLLSEAPIPRQRLGTGVSGLQTASNSPPWAVKLPHEVKQGASK